MYCTTWNNFLFNYWKVTSPDSHTLYPLPPMENTEKNPYLGSTVLISFSNWSAARDCKNKNLTVRIHKISDRYFFHYVECLRTIWPTSKKSDILGRMITNRNIKPVKYVLLSWAALKVKYEYHKAKQSGFYKTTTSCLFKDFLRR